MDASTQTDVQSTLHQCLKCLKNFATTSALGRHTKDKHSTKQNLSSSKPNQGLTENTCYKQTYKPPILEEPSCPINYQVFWQLKAKTRRLPPNRKRYTRFVAPRLPLTMLELAERVNLPDLLGNEFVAFAQAYNTLVQEKNFASIDTDIQGPPIGVTNAKQDLILSGHTRLLSNIQRTAPVLPIKNLKILTDDTIVQFFAQARIHMFNNSIPWDNFSSYFLNSTVLGAEISTKVTNVLHGYPEEIRPVLRNFSCFIQHIIHGLLPIQESYPEASLRILRKHKEHLTGPNPSIEYTNTHIHADAQDLTRKSPYFKQVCTDITDEQHTAMIEKHKTNLLHSIIADTTYEATVHELLIGSSKYKEITDVPNQELIDTLRKLILAEEKSAIARSNESPVLLPPTYFNTPPPTYFNTPHPPYFNTPPPNFSKPPPNFDTPPPNYRH